MLPYNTIFSFLIVLSASIINATDIHSLLITSDKHAIQMLMRDYPEMVQLTGEVNSTPEGLTEDKLEASPSKLLFGKQHIEFDRTWVGFNAIRWVLNNNYDQFTNPQNVTIKLSVESFSQLQAYTKSVLQTPEDVDAMIVYMVINDLGKVKNVVKEIEQRIGMTDVDHDKILLTALKEHPEISPSFQRLSDRHQKMIIRGLEAQFNIGQFIQGENVPGSLTGLNGLDKDSLDFYLLHALFDIAGAAGHVNASGSVIMTEPTYQGFRMGFGSLEKLAQGANPTQVYNDYLAARGKILGIDTTTPFGTAAVRINLMLRSANTTQAQEAVAVMQALPENARAILEKELSMSGVDDGIATLLYYSPATLANIITALKQKNAPNASSKGLEIGLITLARLYQAARIEIRKRTENGVYTLMISKVAEAAKSPETLGDKDIVITAVGNDGEASLHERHPIRVDAFPFQSLAAIPGKKIITIGIGGGSDGIQAAQLAKLMKAQGKQIGAVISVRTAKPGSADISGNTPQERTIENHGGEIIPGVFRVTPETTGSGRFLENIPADQVAMYLVIDSLDGKLAQQIEAAIADAGGADTLVAVDTGGDALFQINASTNNAHATPDQDLRVLQALASVANVQHLFSAEIAIGIDSPDNAEQILAKAGAYFYTPTAEEAAHVVATYAQWKMDGSDKSRYGKTALTWQAALRGERGIATVALPKEVVLSPTNPWNPFVHIESSTRGIFFMRLADHLKAIGV